MTQRSHHEGAQEYYLADGLGSTTGIADGSKTVVATHQYDAFGAVRAQTGGSANEFTYTGEQVDSTGLEYLRARYYDQATGRFWSKDPAGGSATQPQSWNLYPYVLNNPVNLIDPSGLDEEGPKPIPAPIAPGPGREDYCDRGRDRCTDYGHARGILDAFSAVCNDLYYDCLNSGYYDTAEYEWRWGHLPVIYEQGEDRSIIDAIVDILSGIDLPNTGRGAQRPSKEGDSFGCGSFMPSSPGWPGMFIR
jgi:RHS repeat-associated protein